MKRIFSIKKLSKLLIILSLLVFTVNCPKEDKSDEELLNLLVLQQALTPASFGCTSENFVKITKDQTTVTLKFAASPRNNNIMTTYIAFPIKHRRVFEVNFEGNSPTMLGGGTARFVGDDCASFGVTANQKTNTTVVGIGRSDQIFSSSTYNLTDLSTQGAEKFYIAGFNSSNQNAEEEYLVMGIMTATVDTNQPVTSGEIKATIRRAAEFGVAD